MTPPEPTAQWVLDGEFLGQRIAVYDRLDSTNTLALSLAQDPDQHGVVILAREQTAGRGQYGRSWHAPPGSSVLMSLLLFPPLALRRPALLTAWAAVSVCETILKLANLQATIKWPNDVLLHGKKICGILIEQRTTGNTEFPLASVIGIGLNVAQTAEMFAQAQLAVACSLAMVGQRSFRFDEVAKTLIAELDAQYAALIAGDFATLEAQWQWRLGLLGKMVVVEGMNQHYRGRLIDVTLAGLDLEVDGERLRLAPESVKHLHGAE
jgi:BirA family biotin operon repressor/biotin-[acetyl-CoA-carboxylase] ligase